MWSVQVLEAESTIQGTEKINQMNLQAQLQNEMVGIYHVAIEIGYRPAYFIRMVSNLGGLEAARRLLRASVPSEGFFRRK